MTVIDETTLWVRVAVTVTAFNGEAAKARQISAVPLCVFVLRTSTQVKPAPVTPETVMLVPDFWSDEINASNSSLPAVVENADVATVVLAVARSANTFASIAIAAFAANATPVTLAPFTGTV
jgi:hypothetical protein